MIKFTDALVMPSASVVRKRAPLCRLASSGGTHHTLRDRCVRSSCRDCPPYITSSLYCAATNDSSDSNFDAESDRSESINAGSGSSAMNTNRQGRSIMDRLRRAFAQKSWKQNLLKFSSYASLLCILDCTLLPIITILLPLMGIVAASPAQMEFLHELGHQVALYFVLPVGGLATSMNYTQHRKLWITVIGWIGLATVVAANAGCHLADAIPGALGHWLHHALHSLHHGIMHRVTNLTGCFLLLFSNYLSHKQGSCSDPACCSHHHE